MPPRITDVHTLIAAGINPKNGLPYRFEESNKACLKDEIKKTMRILDEQNAINRYVWYNLPSSLDGSLLERILYYRGQGMFFYMSSVDKFFFLPFALDGTIDVYGRFTDIKPVPFNGKSEVSKNTEWLTQMTRHVIYDAFDEDNDKYSEDDVAVILWDYTPQMSQTNIARQILQEPVLDAISEAFPMARTSLLANSGIKGMRVETQDEASNVAAASQSITQASLTGNPWIPILGNVEFQELTDKGSALKSEEYLLYMQALDNFRLSLYGLKNGGLFQKKSHMLEEEQAMNDGNVGLVYQDGLTQRQKFCDLVNSLFGLGIWCEASNNVIGLPGMGPDADMTDEAIAMNEEDDSDAVE